MKDDKKLMEFGEKWSIRDGFPAFCQRAKCKVKDVKHEELKLKSAIELHKLLHESRSWSLPGYRWSIESIASCFKGDDKRFLDLVATNNKLFLEKVGISAKWKSHGFLNYKVLELKVCFYFFSFI